MSAAPVFDAQAALRQALRDFQPQTSSALSLTVQKALHLARYLQLRATELQTPSEKKQQTELDRMIQNPHDKATLTQLTDQAFRSQTPHRAADQLIHILDAQGVPRFFSPFERTLLKGFQSFGSYLPGVAVPLVKEKMQQETANVILPAEREMLTRHLHARRREGVGMNVNFLGEALLGEQDAQRRLQGYLQALQLPEIEVISVKISTIYSQIHPLGRRASVDVLCDRLELLYRAAARATFVRGDGSSTFKFVYLDMEEYRDMGVTAEAFMRTLDRPALKNVHAGIVLQSYIPDALPMQQCINAWARKRRAAGGAAVRLRIVKGANLEMERVEASIHGWPQAPYKHKLDTDSNYKRMLHEGMQPENLDAVHLGVASHNLFELAYALVMAAELQALDRVQFEMLEGMANHQRRALFEVNRQLLLYAPACQKKDFLHAIGYLIRRLDENTGPDNFLRHAFRLDVGSSDWNRLESQFVASLGRLDQDPLPRRTQNRLTEQPTPPPESPWWQFTNEPDTDFSLDANLQWAEQIVQRWESRCNEQAPEAPLVIAGQEIWDRPVRESLDPSRPGVVAARYRQADDQDIEQAVACADQDPANWRSLSLKERQTILAQAAQELRRARGELMGAALADGGKTLAESDPEVSEAVDFVEFYRRAAEYFQTLPGVTARPRGVVAVVSPWNFPIAIPCGGVAAALAAGNTVILKPASDTVLTAYLLCQCFWNAGVPQQALQFAPCSGGGAGRKLVSHPRVDTVILTGGTATAFTMLADKPSLRLLAETGGKNATIITAMADRDQAIKNLLHSAFSHGGQKCSATSLLVLEDEVFENADFRRTLCDAVQSLHVGSAWELDNKIGPLIRPPSDDLERCIKELETGESWAVMPHIDHDNPCIVTPGVKWNVQPGSYTHLTEFFGPVLGVMRARNLAEAIALVNQTGFGLTSGLESLDDREQALWRDSLRAGNLYLNRGTTGAIVLRQPFGGMGKSAFGPGVKAGGPNYVAQLMRFDDRSSAAEKSAAETDARPGDNSLRQLAAGLAQRASQGGPPSAQDVQALRAAMGSYEQAMQEEFGVVHDHFRLVGQDNARRYLPVGALRIRVKPADTNLEIMARIVAAKAAGCQITVSHELDVAAALLQLLDELTESWGGAIEFLEESDEQLAAAIRGHQTDRVRYAGHDRPSPIVRHAAAETGIYLADEPVLHEGRLELLWYFQEQSLSDNYHRYGNLGERAPEERAPVL